MKKKIISIALIIAMLILPFGVLLKANAETAQQNGISVDTSVSKSGDSASKLINGQTTIAVFSDADDQNAHMNDTFSAYKVLDAYYNQTTNQISYDFTSSFATFVATLTTAEIRAIIGNNSQATTFTVSDYLALTSDDSSSANNYSNRSINYDSNLRVLVSAYATYVKTVNSDNDNNNDITPIAMTHDSNYTATDNNDYVASCTAAAGSYLILPNTLGGSTTFDNTIISDTRFFDTYGTLIANTFYEVGINGAWQLNPIEIALKYVITSFGNVLTPYTIAEALELFGETPAVVVGSFTHSLNVDDGQHLSLVTQLMWQPEGDQPGEESPVIPSNTHSSITGNTTIMNKIEEQVITLPTGVSLNSIASADAGAATISNGNITLEVDNETVTIGTVSGSTITLSAVDPNLMTYLLELTVDASYFTPGTAKDITTTATYLKDAYKDITGMTQADAEAAVLGTISQTNTLYTFGIKITNTDDASTPAALQGAKFKVYSDSACTEQIGSEVTVSNSNGIVNFVGIAGNNQTYYIKQTSAPTGYNIISTPIALDTSTATLDANNYYPVTAVNTRQGFLPFTGGTGTIIYTAIGLLIVVGAVLFLIIYKKKNKKEDEKK